MLWKNKTKIILIVMFLLYFIISPQQILGQDEKIRKMPLNGKGTVEFSEPNGASQGPTPEVQPKDKITVSPELTPGPEKDSTEAPVQPSPSPGETQDEKYEYQYDFFGPEEEPSEVTRYHLVVPPSARDQPILTSGVQANIAIMIDIIEQMGFPKKAKAARQMLGNKKIFVKDLERHGHCNKLTGNITLDKDDIPERSVRNEDNYRDIQQENLRRLRREGDIAQVFITALTLYHELIHCLQQPTLDISGTRYWLSLDKELMEIEAHGKDLLFAIQLIRNLDQIYARVFDGETLTPGLRAKIIKDLIGYINWSYGFFRLYQKDLPLGVTEEMIREGYEFIEVPVEMRELRDYRLLPGMDEIELLELDIKHRLSRMEIAEIQEPSRLEPTRTITDVDQELGLIKRQEDHFVFTSIGWLVDLAGTYNFMEASAFKGFLDYSFGERTNLNFIYEDGEKIMAGLEVKDKKILYAYNDAMANPTVEINIPRLIITDLINADNFYQATLDAWEENKIKVEQRSFWGKIKYFIYSKIILPFRKEAIIKTETDKILPAELFQKREDFILGQDSVLPEEVTVTTAKCGNGALASEEECDPPGSTGDCRGVRIKVCGEDCKWKIGRCDKAKCNAVCEKGERKCVFTKMVHCDENTCDWDNKSVCVPPKCGAGCASDGDCGKDEFCDLAICGCKMKPEATSVSFTCTETTEIAEQFSMQYITVKVAGNTYKFPVFACADEFNYKVAWCGKVKLIPADRVNDENYVKSLFYEAPVACPCDPGFVSTGCLKIKGESSGLEHGSCVCAPVYE